MIHVAECPCSRQLLVGDATSSSWLWPPQRVVYHGGPALVFNSNSIPPAQLVTASLRLSLSGALRPSGWCEGIIEGTSLRPGDGYEWVMCYIHIARYRIRNTGTPGRGFWQADTRQAAHQSASSLTEHGLVSIGAGDSDLPFPRVFFRDLVSRVAHILLCSSTARASYRSR